MRLHGVLFLLYVQFAKFLMCLDFQNEFTLIFQNE